MMILYGYRLDIKTGEMTAWELETKDDMKVEFPVSYAGADHYGVYLKEPNGLLARQIFLNMLKKDIAVYQRSIDALTLCV